MKRTGLRRLAAALLLAALVTVPRASFAAEYYLRADVTTKTMPDAESITMWGFARDSSFGQGDGTVAVPGPILTVPPGDTTLTIHLDNNLSVPVSIVIPGQIATMVPVRNPDGRARSFTHETPPGNSVAVDYVWTGLKPGTYIYHSGTHPAVQVQMGLYGGIKKDAATGQVYPGVAYDAEVMLFYSEIDPALHEAVATGNYGPGEAMTSTVNYHPKYFLVNGEPFEPGDPPLPAGAAGEAVLIRFFNAGIKTHVPVLLGMHMSVVAEDGYPYNNPRQHYALLLPAMKTRDAIVTPDQGTYPIYDYALALTNAAESPGGLYVHLEVSGP